MKNIHVIPTDKPSRLYLNSKNNTCITDIAMKSRNKQNIYITNDEEIKEGDCVYNIAQKTIFKADKSFLRLIAGTLLTNKKIILTTDQDLIKDGVQEIDNEFLNWFVKNPSCEEVEIINEQYTQNYHKDIWYNRHKIIIPKEECKDCNKSLETCTCIEDTINMKQETFEEDAERLLGMFNGYSFLKDALKQLKEKRIELKISFNKMSKDLYGNRYYVNYLSKVEKGEIPNVSFEVIARMINYLEQFKNK